MKPRFVPPFLKKGHGETDASPAKRAKTAEQEQDTKPQASGLRLGLSRSRVNSVRRKPFLTMANPIATAAAHVSSSAADERHFTVVWRKPTNKKHKSWDGDGIVSIVGGHCTLQDMSGKEIGTGKLQTIGSLEPGDEMRVGSKEIELQDVLSRDDYMSGKMFLKNAVAAPATDYTSQMHVKHASLPQPRHDPNGPNALVLSRPNPRDTRGPIVDVVVDPFLAKHLRPHQREGISFLYDCVMKIKSYDGQGAILADDMGLGKTLQTIALLWTLLKQNPIPHQGPIVRKALVVCPVSLMMNWKKEFKKWLGEARIGVYIVDNKANLRDFVCGKVYSVMIIGYERIRQVQENDELKNANFDIVICDEGHRLKTSQNKSAQAIRSIKTARRIILSGTPIQNDLGEFFVMIDFVNPGLLGTYNTFKKTFENPIVKARQPEASQREKEKGQARSNELTRLTDMFILRRTSDLLLHTLPPKTECVVFCRPTELQMTLHKRMAESPALERCLRGDNSAARLGAIIQLRKICNSPILLSESSFLEAEKESSYFKTDDDSFSRSVQKLVSQPIAARQSGKLLVLERFLQKLVMGNEKIVIVSHFTQTLGLIQNMLHARGMTFLRLDGTTPTAKRQGLVDSFNTLPASKAFAFLLSAKSGGVGINLIGASRLVLFDSDWNPATDLQAMARVHREGQKRPVFIYRFLTTGMIDEKIYQRQVTKQGLSDALMDAKASGSNFSLEELRDLFRLHEETDCATHEMLGCVCQNDGCNLEAASDEEDDEVEEEASWTPASQVVHDMDARERKKRKNSMKTLQKFQHISPRVLQSKLDELAGSTGDELLEELLSNEANEQQALGAISYLFTKRCGAAPLGGDVIVEEEEDV